MTALSKNAAHVLSALHKKGYKAYIVGGAVRSFLMGNTPDDTDITTDALPNEIKEVFSGYKVIETGIQHGTVTVLIGDEAIEITTFRTEDGYTDGRHPDKVSFSRSIEDDLKRRDFTMNSIAFCPSDGYTDPFGGREDICNKIIRCVGVPEERFREDSLRILRGLRFASVTGFSIEDNTSEAMFSCKDLIRNISVERIYTETVKMLCGSNVKNVIITYFDIIAEYLPEIASFKNFDQHNYHHKYDLLNHTATVVESIEPIPHLRLAALLHDVAKPLCMTLDDEGTGHFYKHASKGAHIAEAILRRLHSDKDTTERVTKLIKWHDTPIDENEETVKRKLRVMGEEMLRDLIKLQRADTLGLADEFHNRSEHFDRLEGLIDKVISDGQCFSLKELKINGNDMLELGLKNKEIGAALNYALEGVISNSVKNDKDSLIEYIKESRQ